MRFYAAPLFIQNTSVIGQHDKLGAQQKYHSQMCLIDAHRYDLYLGHFNSTTTIQLDEYAEILKTIFLWIC